MSKTYKKAAIFTDIHFGARGNSIQHNEDCLGYLRWFSDQIKDDPEVDHVVFLGDYFEHRGAISGLTLDYAYRGAKIVNDIGLPVYFLSGNHDYFYRNTRDIHNTKLFESLTNFIVVNEITVFPELGERGAVMAPYLFEHEYGKLLDYPEYPVLYIHAEFKGFVITGDTIKKEHGPDHTIFNSFKRIMSGHYHKRQTQDNVTFVGNTFPTNFADANDNERGMSKYTYKNNKIEFLDWSDAPTYVRCKLSQLMAKPKSFLKEKATVQCLVDVDLTYEESLELKDNLTKKYKLRELTLDEGFNMNDHLEGDVTEEDDDLDNLSMINVITEKLKTISTKSIDNEKLIKMFSNLSKK